MALSAKSKYLLALLATVSLGAVGSGLWDWLLKPTLLGVGRGLLTLVTLGLASAKNNVYQEAAKGYHELPVLFLFSLISASLAFGPAGVATGMYVGGKLAPRILGKEPAPVRGRVILIALLLVLTLLGSVVFVQFLMVNYENLAITHFQQCLAICAPYLTLQEQRDLASKFAQIQTKEDYVAVISRLKSLGAKNSLQTPEFEPW
jgi:hypothetical protein